MLLLVIIYLSLSINAQCVHPPYAKANKTALHRKIFHDYYLGRWTYNVIKEYRGNAKHILQRRNERDQAGYFIANNYSKFQSRLYGQAKCRRHRPFLRKTIDSTSTCPWYTVIDVDLNREPRTMAKAKCSCKRCQSVGETGRGKGHCTTVNSYVPVIKWECPHNAKYYTYFIHLETVPVGCTCKRPHEV